MANYHCKKFCGNDAELICSLCALKEAKNSQLLAELVHRIKTKEIRFNYSNIYPPQNISGLISWDVLDEYDLDFTELEEYLEKLENNPN